MTDGPDLSDLDLEGKVTVVVERIGGGGFSDISKGILLRDGTSVEIAIKWLRIQGYQVTQDVTERLRKHFYREVLVWRKLQHSNVVPLLGYTMSPSKPPAMICPWYSNGNVIAYLESFRDPDPDPNPNPNLNRNPNRDALALDVVNGLDYLHSVKVIHGDLKGENVLVDSYGHASLCDFGMSQFIDDAGILAGFMTTNAGAGGTDRFVSPEILDGQPKSIATDMWALGCLVLQILTSIIPFQHITGKYALIRAIMKGELPVKNDNDELDGPLWECLKKCWSDDRPRAYELRSHLTPLGSKEDTPKIDVKEPEVEVTKIEVTEMEATDKFEEVTRGIELDKKHVYSEELRRFKAIGRGQPRYTEQVLWNSRVSPWFGDLMSTVQDINDITKVAIIGATKAVLRIKEEHRDWTTVVTAFNNSALLRQLGEEQGNHDTYTNHAGPNWFKFDTESIKATIQEVQGWIKRLINDSEVLQATRICIDDVKNIVATTGRAIAKLAGDVKDKNYREISIVEFGVIRYPQINDPYFKLYCVKLFAWATFQGSGLFKKNNSGIRGVFLKRRYQPNDVIIKKMKKEVFKRAVAEAEKLFISDDN